MALIVRAEQRADRQAIFAVNAAAFETNAEAELVERLGEQAHPLISLVAEQAGRTVGHILFSPVTVEGQGGLFLMGLGPMALLPEQQRKGIGSALVRAGLDRCRESGVQAVVVLGHPQLYPRFGFEPASDFGLRCEYDVPDEVFMAMEIQPGILDGASGLVHYHPAFASV
jgi:putative acetyltransferase